MDGEICHFGLQKDPKGLTDAFYGCEKDKNTSWICELFIFKRHAMHLEQSK